MIEWDISDDEIEATERLLLPYGAHFPEDARKVIRCWHSSDVSACPGSGKTTVLLAKLKLLADRMPFDDNSGVCVLSHTNVAVDEIRKRLSCYEDKLHSYPNFIGTIQSFIDRFVTMPYIRKLVGHGIQIVDNLTYANHLLQKMKKEREYRTLCNLVKSRVRNSNLYDNDLDYIQAMYIGKDGSLYVGKQKERLAGAGTDSAKQYKLLIDNLLKKEGIIKYNDAYHYAEGAIDDFLKDNELFSFRFQYVFIDEYQDCDDLQRKVLEGIFNTEKCMVMKIGDPDQAIFNSINSKDQDWIPRNDFLPIMTSCRYGQEIADVISNLKKNKSSILTFSGKTGLNPVLIVYDDNSIGNVIEKFNDILGSRSFSKEGIYKAIGAIKKEETTGRKISSYWTEFDSSSTGRGESSYWIFIDGIVRELSDGKLYKAEQIVRKLLCIVSRYLNSDYRATVTSMKQSIDSEYRDEYCQGIYELSELSFFNRQSVDPIIERLCNIIIPTEDSDIKSHLPKSFKDEPLGVEKKDVADKNVWIDVKSGRRIIFDTIHGVKGETHDATLYLETDYKRSSDLNRILPFFGVGEKGSSDLFDHFRKLAYVGMSRPRKLLCVAISADTYNKSEEIFSSWEIVRLEKAIPN